MNAFYLLAAALGGALCRRICGGAFAAIWVRGVTDSRLVLSITLGGLHG